MAIMIQNARIDNVVLGHAGGVFTVKMRVAGDGWEQEFGGVAGPGVRFVQDILDVMGCEEWEDLLGTYCRIDRNGESSLIVALGHIVRDEWVVLADYMERSGDARSIPTTLTPPPASAVQP